MSAVSKDRLAGYAYRALALQRLGAYREARDLIEHCRGDLSGLPETISYRVMQDAYLGELQEIAQSKPDSTAAELAYTELVAQIHR